MKKVKGTKILAFLLCLTMLFSVLPLEIFAFADEAIVDPGNNPDEEEEIDIYADPVSVSSAAELEEALINEVLSIKITADFAIDRTFYVISDAAIYTDEAHTLKRADGFTGDIFVVGQYDDGTFCEDTVTLYIGRDDSKENDLLTIDGENRDVLGTVFFATPKGEIRLFSALTVQNCKKVGNERTHNEAYGLSYPGRVGGPVAIVTSGGKLGIYGGKYINNTVNNEDPSKEGEDALVSTWGGAFYCFGTVNVYDGLFKNNHAQRGGAFYAYRTLTFYGGTIEGNSAAGSGGAIYMPASGASFVYLYGENDYSDTGIVFKDNHAENYGGMLYASGARVSIDTATIIGNSANNTGGAIYCSIKGAEGDDPKLSITNTTFENNRTLYNGGAIYATGTAAYMENVTFKGNHATATANSSGTRYGGGAIYSTGSYFEINGATFDSNTSDNYGAGIEAHSSSHVVLNNITTTNNIAQSNGGFIYANGSVFDVYNSAIRANHSENQGGAAFVTASSSLNAYLTTFEGNSSVGNGGAILYYSKETPSLLHSCVLLDNTSGNFGGGIYISNASLLDIYNLSAKGNGAYRGGFLYETTTGTIVTISGLTVSGNTASDGGPIIWGNSTGAKLYINKDNYLDVDYDDVLDDAYWETAIVNSLKVYNSDAEIPGFINYGDTEETNPEDIINPNVTNPVEFQKALSAGLKEITIISDFTLNRTFYITADTTIKATGNRVLTRAPGFAGDIFLIGEDADGNAVEEEITVTFDPSGEGNSLTIDGNRDNMTADVVGTVFFVAHGSRLVLKDNLIVENCYKVGNERTFNEVYGVSYPIRIGAPVAINANSKLDIYGGIYRNNSVLDETDENTELVSTQGGAIYSFGATNIYGGTFSGNHAARGGAIYNYRTTYIYNAEFIENSATSSAGAIYMANSTACKLYIGNSTNLCDSHVLFKNNSSDNIGGAIVGQGAVLQVKNAEFLNNTSGANGGDIYVTSSELNPDKVYLTVEDSRFSGSSAYNNGGSVYISKKYAQFKNVDFENSHAFATENSSGNRYGGGAIYATAAKLSLEGVRFKANSSDYDGGAVMFNSASEVSLYNITADGNTAGHWGGFMYSKSAVDIYNSNILNNSAAAGGAILLQSGAVTNVYSTRFEKNSAPGSGGAIQVYTGEYKTTFNNCEFIENSTDTLGGGFYVSGKSDVDLYNCYAEGNSANRGGFFYETVTGSIAVISGLTVKGNTAKDGGPIIWGNSAGAKLYINKTNYKDLDTNNLDSNYWKGAIYNSLKVYEITTEAPPCPEYGNEVYDNLSGYTEVSSAEELEAAIDSGATRIRIVADFSLDRTFFITRDVTIFSTTPYRLTRAKDFYGDIFVVGETKDGKSQLLSGNTAKLTLGNPESATEGLLIIDGNKNAMEGSVYGSVIFICNSGNVAIYNNISIVNARKTENKRTLEARYTLSNESRIGGAMAIVESGTLNIYGGNFKGISVDDEDLSAEAGEAGRDSTLGGAIYNQGDITISGGNFEYCSAARGGALYNYRFTRITAGNFINNSAKIGGAIYMPSNDGTHIYIGGTTGTKTVTFDGNSAKSNAGAIYSGTKVASVIYGDTEFKNNVSNTGSGGAIYAGGTLLVTDTTFKDNYSKSKGGAVFHTHGTNDAPVRMPKYVRCTFTGNESGSGGALTSYTSGSSIKDGPEVTLEDCVLKNNTASSGGAITVGYSASLNLKNVTLENNSCLKEGGAIYMLYQSEAKIENSKLINNTSGDESTGYGGAISLHSSKLDITDSTIDGNTSGLRGGALYVSYNSGSLWDSEVMIKNSSISGNTCYYAGGAMYVVDRLVSYGVDEEGNALPKEDNGTINLVLKDVTLNNNIAGQYGGATFLTSYSHTYMEDVTFEGNSIAEETTSHNGGAVYGSVRAVIDINGATFKNNHAGSNAAGIGLYTHATATLNNITASGNTAPGDGGFMNMDTAYATLYNSDISNNTAGSQGGAISMVDLSTINIYNTRFTGNSSKSEGGAIFAYQGAALSSVNGCTFTENTSGSLGGAIYVANSTYFDIYNTTGIRNHANKGGFLYETTKGSIVNIDGLTVTGNTDNLGGPIIWGNTLNAKLYINKNTYVDTEASVLDDAYWAAAIYNLLTVGDYEGTVPEIPTYKPSYTPPKVKEPTVHPELAVEHIFELAENANHGYINSTYAKFPKLDNSSNFMSKNTTIIENINGENVSVDSFIYHKDDPSGNGNFGEGMLIYQALCYKRANPDEEMYISISAYRFSAHTAICIDRDSPYFGYMRALHNTDYDEFGFVRISYLLLAAARMGINVTVIGQIDGYPNTSTSPKFKDYFGEMLDAPCDSTYTTGVIGDYMTFAPSLWDVESKGGTDMMHTKLCAVSHYLDMNGVAHKNAVWTSSANLDGINANGTNGLNQLQTATLVSDHAELFRISKNYLDLLAQYSGQEDVYPFRDLMMKRVEEQIALIKEGRESEIPADEQIIYLGTETDPVFELYFSPFSGGNSTWNEETNPFAKQISEMHDSEGSIIFIWNNVRWGAFSLRNQFEDVIIDAFKTNKNPENKIYVNLPAFDSAAFSNLKVGEDIGYKAFNANDFGHVHSKDMHVSYVKDGQRYYVSVLNSMNVHGGSMAYQSNFALVIKETDCDEDSVFFTFADETTVGIVSHEYEDTVLEYIPENEKEDGYTYHPCKNCDEREIIDVIHRAGEWNVIKAASEHNNGIAERSCSACGTLIEAREFVFQGEDKVLAADKLVGKTFGTYKELQNALSVSGKPLTIEATIMLDKSFNDRAGVIVGNYEGSKNDIVNIEVSTYGHIRLYLRNGGQVADHTFKTDIRSDEKTHIAVTFEDKVAKLYINSVLTETATLSVSVPEINDTMWIGGDSRNGNNQFFKGTIYSVNIFDHARSDSEIHRDSLVAFETDKGMLASRYFSNPKTILKTGKTFTETSATEIGTLSAAPKTIEATIQLNKNFSGRAGVIFGNYKDTATPSLSLEIMNGGRVRLYGTTEDGSPLDIIFKEDIRSDEPVHIALTINERTLTLYINGEAAEKITASKQLTSVTNGFMIGGDNRDGNAQYFKGIISSVSVFSDVRTADEIKSDMTADLSGAENILCNQVYSEAVSVLDPELLSPVGTTYTAQTEEYTELLPTAPQTIEATIQLDKDFAGRGGIIVGNYDEKSKNQMSLEIHNDGKVRIFVANNVAKTSSYTFAADIRSDSAVNIAVTIDGTVARLYVNGIFSEAGNLTIGLPTLTSPLRIGGDNRADNVQYFKGTIYSINLFSDVRTEEEIKADVIHVNHDADGLMFAKNTATANNDAVIPAYGVTFTDTSAIELDTLAATPHTLEATIQLSPDYHGRGGIIVGNFEDLSLGSMSLEIHYSGKVRLYYATDKAHQIDCTFATDIRSTDPVHIAVTIDGLVANLYINGELTEQKTLPIEPNTQVEGFKIGGDNREGNIHYFKGSIYSVSLFSDVRTEEEIKSDMVLVSQSAEDLLFSDILDEAPKKEATETIPVGNEIGIGDSIVINKTFSSTPNTFEAVLKLDPAFSGRGGVIVGNYSDGRSNQLNLEIYTEGRVRLYYSIDAGHYVNCTFQTDIRSENAVHIAVVVEGLVAKLYVNGEYKEEQALGFAVPEVPAGYKLGSDNRSGNTQHFKGTLYSVSLFASARTAAEIASDYIMVDINDSSLVYNAMFATDYCALNGHTAGGTITDIAESETSNRLTHTECSVCGTVLEYREIQRVTEIVNHMVWANATGLTPSSDKSGVDTELGLITTPLTFEATIQLDKTYSQRAGVIIGNYDGTLVNQMNLEIYTNGRPRLYYSIGAKSYSYIFTTDIRSTEAVHLAITIEGLSAKLYIGGELKETVKLTAAMPTDVDNLKIGQDNRTGTQQYFAGTIYSVNIFSDVRTAEEIAIDRYLCASDTDGLIYQKNFIK